MKQHQHLAPAALSGIWIVNREIRHHPAVQRALIDLAAMFNAGIGEGFLHPIRHFRRIALIVVGPRYVDLSLDLRCQQMRTVRLVRGNSSAVVASRGCDPVRPGTRCRKRHSAAHAKADRTDFVTLYVTARIQIIKKIASVFGSLF